MKISPEIQRVFQQIRWLEKRRTKIIESVSSHFSKATVQQILEKENLVTFPLNLELELSQLIDERNIDDFLRDLANRVEVFSAQTIAAIRKHTSVYRDHVDEQIRFGSRYAGQDAGRYFLSSHTKYDKTVPHLEPIEVVQAVFELTYNGFPGDKNYFLCLRSFGGSTVHFQHSPHLKNWASVGTDPKFLHQIKVDWMKGILDILSPGMEFSFTQAIETGAKFGLAQFYSPEVHANP